MIFKTSGQVVEAMYRGTKRTSGNTALQCLNISERIPNWSVNIVPNKICLQSWLWTSIPYVEEKRTRTRTSSYNNMRDENNRHFKYWLLLCKGSKIYMYRTHIHRFDEFDIAPSVHIRVVQVILIIFRQSRHLLARFKRLINAYKLINDNVQNWTWKTSREDYTRMNYG